MASMIRLVEASVTPTVTAGAYSASDVVGGRLSFSVQAASGVYLLKSVRLVDDGNVKAAGSLYLFNSAPTAFADNAAFEPVIGDLSKVVASVAIAAADYTTLNGNALGLVDDRSGIKGGSFTVSAGVLYGYFVCSGTPTYTAVGDLTISIALMSEG